MKKTYHHGDLRDSIVRETLAMIKADETHLIGFRELARRLDVSRTAPYRHFESVESLLAVVAEEGYEKFIGYLEGVTAKENLSAHERFVQLGETYIRFALDNPEHYRLLFDPRFFAGDKYQSVQDLATKAFLLLKETSAACLGAGATSAEKLMLANLAWASVHGLSSLLMNGQLLPVKNRKQFIRNACERLLKISEV